MWCLFWRTVLSSFWTTHVTSKWCCRHVPNLTKGKVGFDEFYRRPYGRGMIACRCRPIIIWCEGQTQTSDKILNSPIRIPYLCLCDRKLPVLRPKPCMMCAWWLHSTTISCFRLRRLYATVFRGLLSLFVWVFFFFRGLYRILPFLISVQVVELGGFNICFSRKVH